MEMISLLTIKLKELIDQNSMGDIHYIELKVEFPGRFNKDHCKTRRSSIWQCLLYFRILNVFV
ncbi:MAG: hypothetical protein ACTTKU_04050 [Eggerthia catenaformis]|uniref:hypothetical protein n=1 Tax=Eggerthia catenaformis TaxID=31973 RepID=UPI00047A017A|nr:hypothetical protein [Eggerthia catenaformis]